MWMGVVDSGKVKGGNSCITEQIKLVDTYQNEIILKTEVHLHN